MEVQISLRVIIICGPSFIHKQFLFILYFLPGVTLSLFFFGLLSKVPFMKRLLFNAIGLPVFKYFYSLFLIIKESVIHSTHLFNPLAKWQHFISFLNTVLFHQVLQIQVVLLLHIKICFFVIFGLHLVITLSNIFGFYITVKIPELIIICIRILFNVIYDKSEALLLVFAHVVEFILYHFVNR